MDECLLYVWGINLKNTALLIIDMQNGLLKRDVFNKQSLIENIKQLQSYAHNNNLQVVFFRHANNSFSKKYSKEWEIAEILTPIDNDIVIDKIHSSIFKEESFLELLLSKNINTIVVCGLVSNGCIQVACIDAKKNDIKAILISDAHSTWHKDAQKLIDDRNLRLSTEGVEVKSVQEYISVL